MERLVGELKRVGALRVFVEPEDRAVFAGARELLDEAEERGIIPRAIVLSSKTEDYLELILWGSK